MAAGDHLRKCDFNEFGDDFNDDDLSDFNEPTMIVGFARKLCFRIPIFFFVKAQS